MNFRVEAPPLRHRKESSSLSQSSRVIWSAVLGGYQAVAETGKAQGKGRAGRVVRRVACTAVTTMSAGAAAIAGMDSTAAVGQNLRAGDATVASAATTAQAGNVMTITQATAELATDWQSFNIGAGSTVNFMKPSSTTVALNRVLGTDVSVIQGALNANGQVFLVNPGGVLFTPAAQVNAGAGIVCLNLKDGAGLTNAAAGTVTLGNIYAAASRWPQPALAPVRQPTKLRAKCHP